MSVFEIIRIVRRRWRIVALMVVVGLVLGFLTAPGESAKTYKYRSSSTLISNPTFSPAQRPTSYVNLDQAALLVTTGDVPASVAAELDVSRKRAVDGITAEVDSDAQSLTINAVEDTAGAAEQRSTAFAKALIERLSRSDRRSYEKLVQQGQDQVDSLAARLGPLNATVNENGVLGDPATVAERDSVQDSLSDARTALDQLRRTGAPQPVLVVAEYGAAERVDPNGFRAPNSKPQRAVLIGAFGLAIGAAAAVALDRTDTRIRTREDAEDAFGLPVLAEVPAMPRRMRGKHAVAVRDQPTSAFAEAHRAIRTAVSLDLGDAPLDNGATQGRIVVIASAGAGEGKTTTAANLATALAEVGHSVLLVSADLRRPRLHLYLDVPREPGLTDVLGSPGPALRDLVRATTVPGVRAICSGSPTSNPAPLLAEAPDLLLAARQVFDFVVVDTAPLLVANDATELLATADAVVILARSSRTTATAAHRTMETLERLGVSGLGLVMVGGANSAGGAYYYRYYYDDQQRGFRLWRRRTASPSDDGGSTGEPVSASS